MDLVSYNDKHNEANGEGNRDGGNDNESWNCGWEGETSDPEINRLRRKQIKNAISILMISQGVPMILAGDEMGNTQFGNNNAYCQDNEISWLNWDNLAKNSDIFNYVKKIIAFRNSHPVLRSATHLQQKDLLDSGMPDVSWHGTKLWRPEGHTLAVMYQGQHAKSCTVDDNSVYTAINMHWEMHGFELPPLPEGKQWHVFANTDLEPPDDIWDVGDEQLLENQDEILVGPRSVMILVSK
jgi:glycogen operon protein